MNDLIRLSEPTLLFNYDQEMEDPRDGLSLFGPLDKGKPYGIRAGVIGTKGGIKRFNKWVARIQGPISNDPPDIARPPFPGFETVFQIPWNPQPTLEIVVPDDELKSVFIDDRHQRVYQTVNVYSNRILESLRKEETKADIWFVIIPEDVHKYCRPKSIVASSLQIAAESSLPVKYAQQLQSQPSLFPEVNRLAIPYHYEVDFHNQLKARLLHNDAPTQVIRETTLAHTDFLNSSGRPTRKLDKLQSAIAWAITTAVFYKAGGRPWKIGSIREGVCYIGLVFKLDDNSPDPQTSCCAAQMFLDSGDGIVFKGDVGPWYTPKNGEYHLSHDAAKELVRIALDTYKQHKDGLPKELFLHGRVRFNEEEWNGFTDAVDASTNLVGIRIREERNIKLYRQADHPVLRGLAYVRDERTAFLWTRGYVPRLQTYPGREVPNPLLIDVCKGSVAIETVLNDIMALTKLNYNACIFADGQPVTLKFANAVGEILTAGPLEKIPPLPFKYYI